MKTVRKILVVNVNWLGDVVFSTPVFGALKKAYPDAEIVCLAVPRVKAVVESCPWIDRMISYDEDGAHKTLWGKMRLIGSLRREKFDCCFFLHRSLTRALLVFLAGIPVRVGYPTKGRGVLLTFRVKPLAGHVHRSDEYIRVIEDFGVAVEDRACVLNVDESLCAQMRERLSQSGVVEGDRVILVNLGGNWDLKRWPIEKFIELIDRLQEDLGWKVVVCGADKDAVLVQCVVSRVRSAIISFVGKTSLKELLALMRVVGRMVTADTGPLHLASSVGARTVALFGPTRPELTGPRGRGVPVFIQKDVGCNARPCYHLECRDNICMKTIRVDDVLARIQ